ncbi:hypothetical protein F383_20174 [Gossypium arboreum]|uniref:Uncharacterized protein n=1 Tax=Gossypium arboreum TaxID=29729 RepID=A0A0B0NNH9_GOSAR|nr:hypothetical protein F383_20174 [Gossypium arboreum]
MPGCVLGHAKPVGYTDLCHTTKSYACVLGRVEPIGYTDLCHTIVC